MSTELDSSHSAALYSKAMHYIPGGVNSPVRAFKGVGGTPVFFNRAKGAYLYDVDGNAYLDYVGSWGPLILGSAHPKVQDAVAKTLAHGLSFGAPCPLEVELAETICRLMPSIEQVRMVNSGTEATMTAIRLARGVTQRDKFIKFEGCYHGHSDALLVKVGSGALTLGIPSSPGVPASVTQDTLVATFNDLNSVKRLFDTYKDDIAAVILEPIAGNMNLILPNADFLQNLQTLCHEEGALLICDEVMTGFRVALGGAQSLYNLKPDLTTLGKVIGGGMPVGAVGGSAQVMQHLAPVGSVYQAGTLSGNPLAMAAGLATLKEIATPQFFASLSTTAQALTDGLTDAARNAGIPFHARSVGGMFGLYFTNDSTVENFEQIKACNQTQFKQFFHAMLKAGVYFAPSAFEAGFVSSAHTKQEINKTIEKAAAAFLQLVVKK